MITINTTIYRVLFSIGIAAVFQIGFQSAVQAGGMTIGDMGTHAEGRAGAFTAKADDLSAIEYNPAGLTSIGSTQIYLSNRFGYAVEEYKRETTLDRDDTQHSFARVANDHPWQLLDPMIAVGSNFGLKSWAFALGAYAPPGVATQKFPGDGGQRYMLIERDVKILYYNLSVAWKFRDLFGFGASLQWVDAAKIKLSLIVDGSYGLPQPVGSNADFKTTVTGADHVGFSGILGAWVKPLPFLQIALSGRVAPTPINAACKIKVKNYTGDWNDPDMSGDDVDLSMKMPPTAHLGVRYINRSGVSELFDLELDFTYEAWHVMDRYVLDGHGITGDLAGRQATINEIYINKNWKDTFSVRLGGDYNVISKRLTLRAGTFFESGAKENDYAYVDFFASHRLGGSLGASVLFFGFDISLSYSYIYEIPFSLSEEDGKISQQTPSDDRDLSANPAAVANAGDYNSHYHFGSVSVSYTF